MKISGVIIIEGIVKEMVKFVEKLEQMSKDAISDIEQISEKIEGDIRTLLPQEIARVRARAASLIKEFKTKIESLRKRRIQTNPGPGATSFARRITTSLKAAEAEAERLLQKLKEEASAMIQEVRETIRKLSEDLETARGDVTADIRKAGEDAYHSLVELGENAVKKMEALVDDVFKEVELDGSFLWKHSLEITEAATISVVNPFLICSLLASVGMVVAAHKYSEHVKKSP
jgi:hypothetical protein